MTPDGGRGRRFRLLVHGLHPRFGLSYALRLPALCVACVFALATADPRNALAQKKNGPYMEVEPERHDYGNVRQEQKLVHDFTVHNTGTETLVIERISTSCGCTAALVSEKEVAPGNSTTLRVTLDTRKYKGLIHRTVSLASNDKRRVVRVEVQAFVEADW
jgi:hypothetical protein